MKGFRFKAKCVLENKVLIFSAIYHSEGLWWGMIDDNTCTEEYGTGSYWIDENTVEQVEVSENDI